MIKIIWSRLHFFWLSEVLMPVSYFYSLWLSDISLKTENTSLEYSVHLGVNSLISSWLCHCTYLTSALTSVSNLSLALFSNFLIITESHIVCHIVLKPQHLLLIPTDLLSKNLTFLFFYINNFAHAVARSSIHLFPDNTVWDSFCLSLESLQDSCRSLQRPFVCTDPHAKYIKDKCHVGSEGKQSPSSPLQASGMSCNTCLPL